MKTIEPIPTLALDDLLSMAASAIEDLLEHTDPNTSYYSGVWADVPGKLRAAMLQAGNSPANDITNGKPFTITLPDISSKAFWSGTGKAEVFHPETYRRWAKEAIERYCAIARIDVEVK